jgi:hypothetical protein
VWPRCSLAGLAAIAASAALAVGPASGDAWLACPVFGAVAAMLAARMLWECAAATEAATSALEGLDEGPGK